MHESTLKMIVSEQSMQNEKKEVPKNMKIFPREFLELFQQLPIELQNKISTNEVESKQKKVPKN